VPETARRHIPALDGVRGLAILLVIAFHARVVFGNTSEIPYPLYRVLGLGWSGVDLFFVLSGFLITGILLDSRDSPRYFSTFYARRALRIFPLYFCYVAAVLVVVRFGWLMVAGADLWKGTNPWWYVTYLLNWKADHGYNDLFLGHLWSLAIEEQFYIVWPTVVWLVPRRRLAWVCLLVAIGGFAARIYLTAAGFDGEAIYRMTPSRMDALALGALVAVGVREFPSLLDRWTPRILGFAALGFVAVFSVTASPVWFGLPMRIGGATLIAVVYACIIHRAATCSGGAVAGFFSLPLLRSCGKYSYAMYVLHSMPYHLTAPAIHDLASRHLPLALVLAAKYLYIPALAAVAFGAAWVSWRVLERRFIRLKASVPYVSGASPHRHPSSPRNLRVLSASAVK
jgi:peptidoglycan/LPS O-acetylase OafA/YrhL